MDEKEKVILKLLEKIQRENPKTLNYVVPGYLSKKLKSYMLIREDLLFISYLTDKLIKARTQKSSDERINSALWYSIIVIYGKCFTENKAGLSKLEKSILDNEEIDSTELSEKLIELRHSFIAHRDDTDKEQAIVVMKIPIEGDVGDETEYLIKSTKVLSPEINELELYQKLFKLLINKVSEKIQKQAQKVHSNLIATFTPTQMNKFLINNIDFTI